MDEIHVCAECTDFFGGGDWGLCCKSMEYNDLCYDYTPACDRFKPGRKVEMRVVHTMPDGSRVAGNFNGGEHGLSDYIGIARRLIDMGHTNVGVYDVGETRYPRLLWSEDVGRRYWSSGNQ